MLLPGARKFGWLNRFETMHMKSRCSRSVNGKRLERLILCVISPGDWRTFTPLLPKWPGVGAVKAVVSNQCEILRWPVGKLPLAMRFGSPPEVLVPDGSEPEKLGEKYWPVCMMLAQANFQPPITWLTGPGTFGRKRLFLPKG